MRCAAKELKHRSVTMFESWPGPSYPTGPVPWPQASGAPKLLFVSLVSIPHDLGEGREERRAEGQPPNLKPNLAHDWSEHCWLMSLLCRRCRR